MKVVSMELELCNRKRSVHKPEKLKQSEQNSGAKWESGTSRYPHATTPARTCAATYATCSSVSVG